MTIFAVFLVKVVVVFIAALVMNGMTKTNDSPFTGLIIGVTICVLLLIAPFSAILPVMIVSMIQSLAWCSIVGFVCGFGWAVLTGN